MFFDELKHDLKHELKHLAEHHDRHHAGGHGGHGRHGGGRRGERGGGPFSFGGGFGGGFGGPGGGAFPWNFIGRRSRGKRGDVRAGILSLLAEEPRNGYQIMQELKQRSQGMWNPSPGSVYPALQQLEDEGLVRCEVSGTGKTFHLTDAGVAEAANGTPLPWQARGESDDQIRNLRHAYRVLYRSDLPLAAAVEQLSALVEAQPELRVLLDFIRTSDRSLIR